jgi:hypothetical protein
MNEVAAQCATSASAHEPVSDDGLRSPPIEPPLSLVEAVQELARALATQANAMERQNELLAQIVAQNADLISALANDEDQEDNGERDLMGNRI